ncbi:PPOX class probable F420-dependent enzyme [Jatrophihabitans sp. GAS493]|uniref:pyridoxamine 5'-phosphate oxidase family protein n=1 Tax=Jatrophihabitans sp. GAS493 TaxID=1907575 RepID=UPI000BB89723|nr:pyridoxamine 5'-phosphate oxidase family protein [Jatrophihabitans sp. GAS493]SOD74805.1 PPOX class probable F420-dependent enzyme [Jatrophihabitans sp. GAS493]
MRLMDATDPDFTQFWSERALSSLTTIRPDGTPHVVPVGVTVDPAAGTAWVITSGTSQKARLVAAAGGDGLAAAACQVDGRRWSTLEGRAFLRDDPATVAEAVRRYALRYKQPRENPRRVVLEIVVSRVLGNV